MATKLKSADIVIVGLGWTGGILAKELADTGLSIVVLERGGPRDTNPDFMYPTVHDELRYSQRHDLMQDVSRETLTFRNNASQTALPMRQLGSFLPGEGVGGAGVHWNGVTWRWLPWDHRAAASRRSPATAGTPSRPTCSCRTGASPMTSSSRTTTSSSILCGISGKAGNFNGQKIAGGNVFEGPRQRDYPNPPMIQTHAGRCSRRRRKASAITLSPDPSANMSQPYINPDGVACGACHYCGYCERFGCEVNAKASPHFTVIPLAARRTERRDAHQRARDEGQSRCARKKRAESVTYIDAAGASSSSRASSSSSLPMRSATST